MLFMIIAIVYLIYIYNLCVVGAVYLYVNSVIL